MEYPTWIQNWYAIEKPTSAANPATFELVATTPALYVVGYIELFKSRKQ
jgi:hypothetical protein